MIVSYLRNSKSSEVSQPGLPFLPESDRLYWGGAWAWEVAGGGLGLVVQYSEISRWLPVARCPRLALVTQPLVAYY